MTSDQIICNAALERAGGNLSLAATLMGIPVVELSAAINECDELRLRWIPTNQTEAPPRQAASLHRPPIPDFIDQEPTPDEMKLAKAVMAEDQLLAQGIRKLGLTPEEAELAISLGEFSQSQFAPSMHIISAGMTRMCIKLQTAVVELIDRVKDVRIRLAKKETDSDRDALVKEEQKLLETFVKMTEQNRLMFEASLRAMNLQAMIKFRLSDRTPAKKRKPGFQPAITVDENGEIK